MKSVILSAVSAMLCVSALSFGQGVDSATPLGEGLAEEAEEMDAGITLPGDYVIGPDDVLGVLFWRDTSLSGDVVVRPDGKITLPLLNEVSAAGLTTEALRARLTEEALRYLDSPTITVVVREIHSRKVFITGEIAGPGTYPLSSSMTVMQLIATAGGLREYAKRDKIVIMRFEDGQDTLYRFNYKHILEGKNVDQNIRLKPGDTVIVP